MSLVTSAKQKTASKAIARKPASSDTVKPKKGRSIAASAAADRTIALLLKKSPKQSFYTHLDPMLATLVSKPFDDTGWLYEIKWDGYRAISFMNKGHVEIKSRNDKSFNAKYYPVFSALKSWNINAVVDGEIVVVDDKGRSSFGSLQNWRSEADGILLYYVFDVLWYNGHDLRQLPLADRKSILKSLMPKDSLIKLSEVFDIPGTAFLATAKKLGLEGIMAKRKNSIYQPGNRSKDWIKIKAGKRHEVVIGGYTVNEGSSKPFSSLLVGVFEKGKFIYTGKIGTGFSVRQQQQMLQQFKPLVVRKPAFVQEPDVNSPSRFRPNPPKATPTWLQPKLICEVSYTEMTSEGVMRHPSFEGMRDDKAPREVGFEKAVAIEKIRKADKKLVITPPVKGGRKTLLNPTDETQVRSIGGHALKFTYLSKIFWPKEKFTKRDLINYYYQVAPYILPYLKDRPQSLKRYPNGIAGDSFYQKNVMGKVPDWMDTYAFHSDTDHRDKEFLLGNNEATLLFMAGMACIEMNPWSSTTKNPEHPTWCIIDLDPGTKTTFEQVIIAAQATRAVLDELGVPSYPKTSGASGLHIYIPLGGKYSYIQSREFGRAIVTLVQQQLPGFTSIERTVKSRKGKLYLDFLQNRPHATVAAPYSVRPRPGATVSMPLHWEEVKRGLQITDFRIDNVLARLQQEGDIFRPVLGKGINLHKIIHAWEFPGINIPG